MKKHIIKLVSIIPLAFLLVMAPLCLRASAVTTQKIVFTSNRSGNNEVYVMNADGSGLVNLTNNSANDSNPTWSPDGTKIAFGSDRSGRAELWVMNADGSNATQITNTPESEFMAIWSPDSTKIFTIRQDNLQFNTASIMNADGSNVTTVGTPGINVITGIWWSPDSSKYLSYTYGLSSAQISVTNIDGSNEQQLTNGPDQHMFGTWSPDGTKIAYYSLPANGPNQLWVMNADGTNQTAIADLNDGSSGANGLPMWSPDSSRILYTYSSMNDTNKEIRVISSTGGSPTSLISGSTENGGGWINNSQIAFNNDQDGNGEIYTLDINTLAATNLTNNSATDVILFGSNGFIASQTDSPPSNNPPGSTPNPPKTGKLIGATIASFALIGMVLIVGKEIKDRHHQWGK